MAQKLKRPSQTLIKREMIHAAHAAGKKIMQFYGKQFNIRDKYRAGIVTDADVASEKTALRVLKKCRPDFDVVAEESAPKASSADARTTGRWIIDPLDGTTNFAHGFPMFCVAIAAEWDDQIQVGVIYHPVLKDTYVAVRGKGAFLNGRRIQVSKTTKIENALITTGFSYQTGKALHREVDCFEKISNRARGVRRPGSACLDLAFTARGVFDGFWERGLEVWDVAPGSLLVEEAGGKVTNFEGGPLDLYKPDILATNGGPLGRSLCQMLGGKRK